MSGADLAVIICSLNGATGVRRCLDALSRQTIHRYLEVIVVDDGSTDDTSEVARAHGARVIRHPVNRGLATARNSGVRAATAPLVAFLDDDCEPEPAWAESLIAAYSEGVVGVGGPVLPEAPPSFTGGFISRHNPLRPLELNLTKSNKLSYRFYLYLKQQVASAQSHDQRAVYALVGANMSFRRQAVIDAGWFDERFRFGGEESDLCHTLGHVYPASRLLFTPSARVVHHFEPSLRDTLRRSRSYGVGSARLFRKWPSMRPTFFPWPVLVLALLLSSVVLPFLAVVALAAPQALYPSSLRMALTQRKAACLLDAYVHLGQEACGNIGFLHGLWTFRHFKPQSASDLAELAQLAGSSSVRRPGLEKVS